MRLNEANKTMHRTAIPLRSNCAGYRTNKDIHKSGAIVPGGVDEYIAKCPKGARERLREIRTAIRGATPGSTETVSYFQMPGYFYEGVRLQRDVRFV